MKRALLIGLAVGCWIAVAPAARADWNAGPDLVAGKGGKAVDASLLVADINQEYFSPARQQLVKMVIQDMDKGWILPTNPPMQ